MFPYGWPPSLPDEEEPLTYSDGYLKRNLVGCSDCERTDGYHNRGCQYRAEYEDDFPA